MLYDRFESAKKFPSPPVSNTRIALFFEERAANVKIYVYADKDGGFSIRAEHSGLTGRYSRFLAIYSGDDGSLEQDPGRRQLPDDAMIGPHPITAVLDQRLATVAELNEVDTGLGLHRPTDDDGGVYPANFSIDGYNPEARVVSTALGVVVDRNANPGFNGFPYGNWGPVVTTVAGREAGSLPVVTAPRELIALPYASVGGGGNQNLGAIVARGQRWHPPQSVTIDTYVNYTGTAPVRDVAKPEDLPIKYRIARARPQTTADSQLHWEQAAPAEVSWLVEDQDELNGSQDDLFLAGIFLGGSLGFLASTVERFLDLVPLGRRRPDDDAE